MNGGWCLGGKSQCSHPQVTSEHICSMTPCLECLPTFTPSITHTPYTEHMGYVNITMFRCMIYLGVGERIRVCGLVGALWCSLIKWIPFFRFFLCVWQCVWHQERSQNYLLVICYTTIVNGRRNNELCKCLPEGTICFFSPVHMMMHGETFGM